MAPWTISSRSERPAALCTPAGAAFYEKALADDGAMLFPMGLFDRAASLDAIRGASPWASYRLESIEVMRLAPHVGLSRLSGGGPAWGRAALRSLDDQHVCPRRERRLAPGIAPAIARLTVSRWRRRHLGSQPASQQYQSFVVSTRRLDCGRLLASRKRRCRGTSIPVADVAARLGPAGRGVTPQAAIAPSALSATPLPEIAMGVC